MCTKLKSTVSIFLLAALSVRGADSLATAYVEANLNDTSGAKDSSSSPAEHEYYVLTQTPSLASHYADQLVQGHEMTEDEQRAYVATLKEIQDQLGTQLGVIGVREIARTQIASSAIIIAADESVVDQVTALQDVRAVQLVVNLATQQEATSTGEYKEVIPAVGASTLRAKGIDGRGVRIAVLDSGIDYTHAAFGGAGTSAAYLAAYGSSPAALENKAPVMWPQGRVIGGYDFVGETWPFGALSPDPNPIAAPPPTNSLGIVGTSGSHGTSVSDIIAGSTFPEQPMNHGVAPAASLYAVKVCSAVGSSCSGTAILKGLDWALDPDGDGSMADHVDVINMSLGGTYGKRVDALAEAVAATARVGVVVCCAAGNSGDNPFIVGAPSTAPEAISVAQTRMPSSAAYFLAVSSNAAPGAPWVLSKLASLSWSPISLPVDSSLAYPSTNPNVCARLAAGSLAGKVALIELAGCNVSYKVAYAQDAGAIAVVFRYPAPGNPVSFAFGGIPADLPSDFVISIPAVVLDLPGSDDLRARVLRGEEVTIGMGPDRAISSALAIESTSSRGPYTSDNSIKPEIAAPGANLAAVSGTGAGFAVFGGTSGATPVVAGSAALIKQVYPTATPLEVKARLMNNTEINTYQDPVGLPGQFAPISRTGAGEVRADLAVVARAAAWSLGVSGEADRPALSFGFWQLSSPQSFTKTVRVTNYSGEARTFTVQPITRFSPGSPGAVTLDAPASVNVEAMATADITVTVTVDPDRLPDWNADSGFYGNDGPRFAALEYGGFLVISDDLDRLQLPWQILPHKAHRALLSMSTYQLGMVPWPQLQNSTSATFADESTYTWLYSGSRVLAGQYPAPGDGFDVANLQYVGARVVDYGSPTGQVLEILVSTWDRHPVLNTFARASITIDTTGDNIADWTLSQSQFGTSDGRTISMLGATTWATSFSTFLTSSDFNSNVAVYAIPLNRLSAIIPAVPTSAPLPSPLRIGDRISFTVTMSDAYSGRLYDIASNLPFVLGSSRYGTSARTIVPPSGNVILPITLQNPSTPPQELGFLFFGRNGRNHSEVLPLRIKE